MVICFATAAANVATARTPRTQSPLPKRRIAPLARTAHVTWWRVLYALSCCALGREANWRRRCPACRAECAASRNAIIESNSVMEFLHPHLYLVVLDLATADFKTSAKLYLERADAIVLRDSGTVRRKGAASFDVEGLIESKPKFAVESPELVAFVRERLAETMCHPSQWRAART